MTKPGMGELPNLRRPRLGEGTNDFGRRDSAGPQSIVLGRKGLLSARVRPEAGEALPTWSFAAWADSRGLAKG